MENVSGFAIFDFLCLKGAFAKLRFPFGGPFRPKEAQKFFFLAHTFLHFLLQNSHLTKKEPHSVALHMHRLIQSLANQTEPVDWLSPST